MNIGWAPPARAPKEVSEGWLLIRDVGDLARDIWNEVGVCERGRGEVVLFTAAPTPSGPGIAGTDIWRARGGEDARDSSRDGNEGGIIRVREMEPGFDRL